MPATEAFTKEAPPCFYDRNEKMPTRTPRTFCAFSKLPQSACQKTIVYCACSEKREREEKNGADTGRKKESIEGKKR